MKKILILALVFALSVVCCVSCIPSKNDDNDDKNKPTETSPLEKVTAMYAVSKPTKIVAKTTHTIGSVALECSYELVNGTIDGNPASVYTVNTQELETIENGGGTDVIKPLIKSVTRKTEAIQGVGSRINGGEWDPTGEVYYITEGDMAINLDKDSVTSVEFKDNVLTFTIPEANAGTVLGSKYATDIASNVKVTIVTDGSVVTSIELTYSLKGNSEANLIESEMVVKVDYSYDLEKITIS